VDLTRVRGSGPGGRILCRDVESAPTGKDAHPTASDGACASGAKEKPYPPPSPRPPERVLLEGMRKAIATALRDSKQSIPHFYATISVDMGAVLSLKADLDANGVKVSINDIIIRACTVALRDEPRMNCRVFQDRIEYPPDINIGIAVGNDEGLVVPVVLKAQTRDLAGTAAECRRIIEAALHKKLVGSGQGTFTVSNLGMFGIESFTAIINPPEGAILAVGAVQPTIVPHAGGLIPRPLSKLTLSSDHRAIDGILAAKFLARLRYAIEHAEML
jgi:pyruvate dehydrogenase E2 component (dihydrolipoamide acetyltransferase)